MQGTRQENEGRNRESLLQSELRDAARHLASFADSVLRSGERFRALMHAFRPSSDAPETMEVVTVGVSALFMPKYEHDRERQLRSILTDEVKAAGYAIAMEAVIGSRGDAIVVIGASSDGDRLAGAWMISTGDDGKPRIDPDNPDMFNLSSGQEAKVLYGLKQLEGLADLLD